MTKFKRMVGKKNQDFMQMLYYCNVIGCGGGHKYVKSSLAM